jgi:hypothetical protein
VAKFHHMEIATSLPLMVTQFVLLENGGGGFEVRLESSVDDAITHTKISADKYNGTVARFGPSLTSSVPYAMRNELMKGKLAAILRSLEQEHAHLARLLKIFWNAEVGAGAPIPGKEEVELVPRSEEPNAFLTDEQSLAMHVAVRDVNEIIVVSATSGAGKTAVAAATVKQFCTRVEAAKLDEIMLVTSTMNLPLSGLAEKLVKMKVKFIFVQSASYLRASKTSDCYNKFRLVTLLQNLWDKPRSVKWCRTITDEERKTVHFALNDYSKFLAKTEFDLDNIPAVDQAEAGLHADAIQDGMAVLLDVYRPNVVVGTLSVIRRFSSVLEKTTIVLADEAGTVACNSTLQVVKKDMWMYM